MRLGIALLIAYVDDILVCSENDEVQDMVEKAIGAVVPLKVTGCIEKGKDGGGSLVFIGRRITRASGTDELTLSVDGSYLGSTFIEYGITKGTSCVSDIFVNLEAIDAKIPLPPNMKSTYHWGQVKIDMKKYKSANITFEDAVSGCV